MKNFIISKKYAPILGSIIWGVISIILTITGFLKLPTGKFVIGLLLYLVGFIPGLLILKRLVVLNNKRLSSMPPKVPLAQLYIPRIWSMMAIMPILGISFRFLHGVLWWLHEGFLLISGSALLCGAATFSCFIKSKTPILRKGE